MSRFPAGVRFEYVECHPSNFTPGTWRKDFIVLHWWNEPAKRPQFGGVVNWFRNPAANVSIQYVVEHNRITQMIPESAMAWHAGNATANRHGIGIEVNPRLSAGDYETTAVLVAEIWRRRGRKLPLRRHREFTTTGCPGHLDVNRVRRRAEQLYAGAKPAASTPTRPTPAPQEDEVKPEDIRTIVNALKDELPPEVWRHTGRDFLNENPQFKDTQVARAYQYSQEGRNEAREVKAMVRAQAATLDKILKSNGEILEAVENAEREVIRATAAEVAAELEAETKIRVKED